MENRCAMIIATPVTGVGLHGGYRGDAWLAHRLEIFRNYTLKSLLNQSNKDFLHWFWFRPEERNNPLVTQLANDLLKLNYPFIMTFDGLMYVDDKFVNYTLKTKARNLMMMLRDAWHEKKFPKDILRHTWENKNKTLGQRLSSSLKTVGESIGNQYDWVYLTRIDSDDMFHKETINLIQSEKPDNRKALIFNQGYIYNIETKQLATWNPPTNPPFHTIIFPGSVFFDSQAHLEYYGNFKSHEDIPKVFNATTLDMNKYMVSFHGKGHISTDWESPLDKRIHHRIKYGSKGYCYTTSGKNISTRWQSRTTKVRNIMIGEEFEGEIKEGILKEFGVC